MDIELDVLHACFIVGRANLWGWHEYVSPTAGCPTDLFGSGIEKYPHGPGFKKTATSKAAANSIAVYATTKRHHVPIEFVAAGRQGLTPDTCAKALNLSVLTVRPRCTELLAAGLLIPTGERRQNESRHVGGGVEGHRGWHQRHEEERRLQ